MAVEGTLGHNQGASVQPGWFWRYSGGLALGASIGAWAIVAAVLYVAL